MPCTTPTLYFPGSKKLVMVVDSQHRFLTSNDCPLKTDIAHMVFVSKDAHQMETLAVNGHQCKLEELVQRIHAYMMASIDPEKVSLPAHKDKATTSRHDVEGESIRGKVYHYIPRHQVDALTRDVLSDIQRNYRSANLNAQLKMDAPGTASTDLEMGHLPIYKDRTIAPPYDDEGKRGRKQHIQLPRHEADALMLTQDVLFGIQNNHRAAKMKKMERRLRMDATALLILKILLVLDVLALLLMLAWRVAFQVRGERIEGMKAQGR